MSEAAQRDRSPAFPVIPLEDALKRLEEFESHFKRMGARPEKVGEAWGINKGYADRIAAAMRYFGLLDYQGQAPARTVVVSDEGRKYLRAQQDEVKREIIKAAALRPKQIAKFWADWGLDRPAEAACLDELILKNGFSDGGARDFLKVYDATISFAGLSKSDKDTLDQEESNGEDGVNSGNDPPAPSRPTPRTVAPPVAGKVSLMEGERVVFTEEVRPSQYLKLIASGELDEIALEALEDFVKRQRKLRAILATPTDTIKKPEWADRKFKPGDIAPASTPFDAHHVGHAGETLLEPERGDAFPECEECGDQVRYTLA